MKFFAFLLVAVLAFGATTKATAANTDVPATEDKMVAVILLLEGEDDKQVVTTIFTTLSAAEKVSKMLDIEMVASDDPVADDVFVFALKSKQEKDITLKMFDEEGYELAAHRVMEVVEGNNYNALNVESLSDGTYIFQLTDAEGAVYEREVVVEREMK